MGKNTNVIPLAAGQKRMLARRVFDVHQAMYQKTCNLMVLFGEGAPIFLLDVMNELEEIGLYLLGVKEYDDDIFELVMNLTHREIGFDEFMARIEYAKEVQKGPKLDEPTE